MRKKQLGHSGKVCPLPKLLGGGSEYRLLSLRKGFSVYLESGPVAVWMEDGEVDFSNKSGGAIEGTLVRVVYSHSS